jgi:ribonuclease HI
MKLMLYVDGGSRGNPGPAGAGVVVAGEQGQRVFEAGFFLGHSTNNRAEYTALLKALEAAALKGARAVEVFSDSELLVRQVNGEYRVRNSGIVPLFNEVRRKLDRFERWKVQHIPRAQNGRADALANAAMDAREDVIECDRPAPGETPARDY